MLRTFILASVALVSAHPAPVAAAPLQQDPVRVVTTLPVYASLAREIGSTDVEVSSIADPNEDAHFVRPKPSFAADLRRADLFVTTGLDLELWVPTLLDRAGNSNVLEGGRGYVAAFPGITLLDVPTAADRSAGVVHIYGNPHPTTDPLRTLQLARNITAGLKRVAPTRAARFDRGLASFTDRLYQRLFGQRLVEVLGGPTLERLALNGTLFDFLETNELDGAPLIDALGGWLGDAEVFRGRQIICYHKNWAYFEDRFGVRCADYVEAKPGIQPTPGHVSELISRMRDEDIGILLAASYFQRSRVETIASRGGATLVQVPLSPGVVAQAGDYFSLVDLWIGSLARAFRDR
jgi:ABC-type Zn uptake system ZnuABC Zn-binding protein ZnuA